MATQPRDSQKIVYQTDSDQFYVGETVADPDPQNPGHWLLPAGCVEMKPPPFTGSNRPQWAGYKWKITSM
ncbi:hypothetical protein SAMN04490200_5519 [Pseudomonas proteolytica]|nr:hypothetical protein SAMN04490200_5519 [Pseudomonas proteolytica]